jgi:hypothetical protein
MALYADIIDLVSPLQAAAGSLVDFNAVVKNTYSYPVGVKVTAALEYNGGFWTGIVIPQDVANIDAQATYTFSGYFSMPDKTVIIHIYSYWYGADGQWYFDDEMTRVVSLASVGQPSISEFRITDFIKV